MHWILIRVLMLLLVDHSINQSNCGMEVMDLSLLKNKTRTIIKLNKYYLI